MEVKILYTTPNTLEGVNKTELSNILKSIAEENKALIIEKDNYAVIKVPEDSYKDAKSLNGWDEKYAGYIYDRDDLLEYEQEELVSKIPDTSISLNDYFQNEVAQELYDKIIDIDYTGKPLFVLKFNRKTKEFYLKELNKE